MPTQHDWKTAYPLVASITYRGLVDLYGGRVEALLDDVLDRKIPEPWAAEAVATVDKALLIARRVERAVATFESAVRRFEVATGPGKGVRR